MMLLLLSSMVLLILKSLYYGSESAAAASRKEEILDHTGSTCEQSFRSETISGIELTYRMLPGFLEMVG